MFVKGSNGDAGRHGFLLKQFTNLEGVLAVGAADDGVFADGGLLAAQTVLLFHDALVLADHILPVELVEVHH